MIAVLFISLDGTDFFYFGIRIIIYVNTSVLMGHPLSTYVKFSENLTFLTFLTFLAYEGVRNDSFSKTFSQVLNGWPLKSKCLWQH